ncbi:MAG: rhodanese-like domain-containing protein [Phycisphaerales bacterium]|nr:MAG: rhodanese-like domain-containing protein [Phycisphaerales bacterium]
MGRSCGARAVLGQSLAIVGVGLTVALAHSWVVQASERPIRLTSGLGARSAERPAATRSTTPPAPAAIAGDSAPEPDQATAPPGSDPMPGDAAQDSLEQGLGTGFDNGFDPGALAFEISTEEAHALWQDELAMFVDTRLHREYEGGHIPGAFWLPADLFSRGRTPEAVNFLDPDFPVVLYCGGGDCDASKNTALLLENYGFTRLHIFTDGIPAWIEAGHPTEAGPDPITGGPR